MGRLHSGGPGASFHGGTELALDFRPSDRLDLQPGGRGRSIERLLQGRHANCRPGTLRRRYLHSDRVCSDTAHQPHHCLRDPFEGAIGSEKYVTRAPRPHSIWNLYDKERPDDEQSSRCFSETYYLKNFETTFPSKLPDGQINAHLAQIKVHPSRKKYFASPIARHSITDSSHPASHLRGAYRDRHERGARDAVDANGAQDECARFADGEVVWA